MPDCVKITLTIKRYRNQYRYNTDIVFISSSQNVIPWIPHFKGDDETYTNLILTTMTINVIAMDINDLYLGGLIMNAVRLSGHHSIYHFKCDLNHSSGQ